MKRSALSLAAVAALVAGPVAAQTVLTVSSWVPPTHSLSIAQKEWCDMLEKNTSGQDEVQHPAARAWPRLPARSTPSRTAWPTCRSPCTATRPAASCYTQMAEFPFLGDTAEPISVAFNKVAMKYPQFAAEHQGVKVLAYFTHGPGIVFNTKRPITKVEDLQGLKWRVGGGMVNEIAKTLGMNVTLKPAPDSYELLSGGVMDGTLFPAESTESFKIDKIIKHATFFPGGLYNTSFVFLMNQAKYDKLSPDEKKAVDADIGRNAARIMGRNWDKVDRRGLALMQANGVQMVKADAKFVADVKAKTGPLEAEVGEGCRSQGPEGRGEGAGRVPLGNRQGRKVSLPLATARHPDNGCRALTCPEGTRLKKLLEFLCGLLAGGGLFAIMALTFFDVLGRKFASNSIPGSLELTELLMVVVIFGALPLVSRARRARGLRFARSLPARLGAARAVRPRQLSSARSCCWAWAG